MRRVVITGMGIWSSIGQNLNTVTESLRKGRSGIIFDASRIEYGYQSGLTANIPRPNLKPYLSRGKRQMMSVDSEYAYMATRQALEQAKLSDDYLKHHDVGIIMSNDGNPHQHEYAKIMEEEHCSLLVGYNAGFRSLTSSAVVNLGSIFRLRGINLTISAACAGGVHAIGVASMFIRDGLEDVILVGGTMDVSKENVNQIVTDSLIIDNHFDANPTAASRPFDKQAIGSVLSGGAGMLVLEDYEHAISRGVPILAEIVSYGYAGAALDEVYHVSWKVEYSAMKTALKEAHLSIYDIDMIHARADSFSISDQSEAVALRKLLEGNELIPITSTDSLAGHEGWTAGINRTIYSVLMMQNGFVAPTINTEEPIDEMKNLNIVCQVSTKEINTILLNSAGVGGSYGAIVLRKI